MIYHRPARLEDALALLARDDVRIVPLAGGTHVLAHPDPSVEEIVDLQDLGLDGIAIADDVLQIGATTTLETVATSPVAQAVAGGLVSEAARRSAGSVLRQQATVGGTLLAAAGYADLAVVLLALDAHVLVEPGMHRLSLPELWADPAGHLAGSLITAVAVPLPPAGARFACERVSRTPSDRAIVAAAVVQRAGSLRVAVGGGLSHPVLLPAAGAEAMSAVEGLPFSSDVLASASYRREMAALLVRRTT